MNFPKYRTFQLVIPMLKEFNIRHIVISPGSRMREFVLAVEEDPFFTTYDVTDERSASYFALGLSQQLNEPVVITCTSSTATTNYVPGVTEAFYQNVPIIVLTGDRDPYMLGCQEDQMINQVGMYDRIVRKSVTLPIVRTQADEWYCERLLNEALLELNHHKMGPVHINVPVPAVIYWNDDKPITEYPKVKKIRRYEISEKYQVELSQKVNELARAKNILVVAGQNVRNFNVKLLEDFFSKYNCTVHAEHMGNIESPCKLNLAIFNLSNRIAVKSNKICDWLTYIGDHTLTILTWHMLSFKIVSLLIINVYGLSMARLAEFPVIEEYSKQGWFLLYFFVGVLVPLWMTKSKYLK